MTLPPRAAALRGDDYQHIIGWYWACQALVEPDIVSVSIEDRSGGAFDDIVVLRRAGQSCYQQIKSSNTDETVVSSTWLTTPATANGKSPLQHFHKTWSDHRNDSPKPVFQLITNRAYDNKDPILGLRDKLTNTVARLLALEGPRSKAMKQRRQWAAHLRIDDTELMDFLAEFELHHEGGERSWARQARDAMRGAGLRTDDDAIVRGQKIVREWVKTGAGPQTPAAIRLAVANADLLARSGTLVFAVHAIDDPAHSVRPVLTVNFVDLYEGSSAFERRQLLDPGDWQAKVGPKLVEAARKLESFGVRRAHVMGAMRLPLWFATGAHLPRVRGWVISMDQNNVEWISNTAPAPVEARILKNVEINQGPDLAVVVALSRDISDAVAAYLITAAIPVKGLVVLAPPDDPGLTSVPDAAFAVGWTLSARVKIEAALAATGARRLHLFFSAPAGAALTLGHYWNLMPRTVLYEHLDGTDYAPTITIS